ncbi:hypothetical protein [Paenibacillus koleovorans]|uniref:hypothetical protein n=1 Tax=Paenibacillus koleovorans TaxID=121608 RepID=UPI000FDA222A|nr:hypothetical protein [Paenibacillus koleovorans]
MYRFVLFWLSDGRQAYRSFWTYIVTGTIVALYATAVLGEIVLFWLIGKTPLSSYTYIHLITAAVAAIGVIITRMIGRSMKENELDTKESQQLFRLLQSKLMAIRSDLEDLEQEQYVELRRLMAELEEQAKYSDPVSHASLAYQEENMLWQAEELQRWVDGLNKNPERLESDATPRLLISRIRSDLKKRNEQLLHLK